MPPHFGQAHVGVVFAQLQPVLGPAGEHAVRLGHALGDQVVHQHAQVGLVTRGHPGVGLPRRCISCLGPSLQRRIHPGKQALRRRLFVARGAVDLSGKKQSANGPRLEVALQAGRVKVVVFNGIAGAQDVGVFQPGHRAHQLILNVKRQAGRDAVGVILVGGQALGLQKNLVAVLVGKAVDLVFHARAIARTHALDLAGEHRAAVKPGADDVVRALVGVGDPARHLRRVHVGPAHEAEHRDIAARAARHPVTGLLGAFREVNRPAIDTRWRAGFEAPLRQLQLFQPRRQAHRRRVARPACRVVVQPHMDLAVQKRTRRQHHGAAAKLHTHLGHGAHHAVALYHQVVNRLLEQPQIGLVFQPVPDGGFVENTVRLRAGRPHGWALAAVQNTKLDARLIGRQRHGATHRVHLAHQMAFANAADGRVTAHLPQRFNVVGEQQRFAAHAGSRERGFGSGMAAADNDHVEFLRVKHDGSMDGPQSQPVRRSRVRPGAHVREA